MSSADHFWVREAAEAGPDDFSEGIPMVEAIAKLRDEISVVSVRGHGYGSRCLSLVLTKLDEARLWAIEYGLTDRGTHLLVDKRQYRDQLDRFTNPTDTTVTTVPETEA